MLRCIFLEQKKLTSGYHPQTNGLDERFNQTLINMLSMYTDADQHDWDDHLPFVLFAYRSAVQSSTKHSPFYLMYGRNPIFPVDIALAPTVTNPRVLEYAQTLKDRLELAYEVAHSNIEVAQQINKFHYNQQQKQGPLEYFVGDQVWVFHPAGKTGPAKKLLRKWKGPFEVQVVKSNKNYLLQQVGSRFRRVVNVKFMKPYLEYHDVDEIPDTSGVELPFPDEEDPQDIENIDREDDLDFEDSDVEKSPKSLKGGEKDIVKIIDRDDSESQTKYLVLREGSYAEEWVSQEEMNNFPQVLEAYEEDD